jgi:hypothetical protein
MVTLVGQILLRVGRVSVAIRWRCQRGERGVTRYEGSSVKQRGIASELPAV